MADPFVSLKREVEDSLKEISSAHNWTSRQVEDALQRMQWDVDMLDESIDRVTANQDKYTVTTAELSQRREFVKGVRSKIQSIREDLSGGYGAAKGVRQKHEELVGSKKEQAEREKARNQVARENQDFLQEENMKQSLIMREQDDALDDLHLSVTRIGEMGLSIHTELKEQESIVDEITDRTDRAVNNMEDVNREVKAMLNSKEGRRQLCLIVSLIGALILVTTLVFFF